MLGDLAMLATLPVDQAAVKKAEDEAALDSAREAAAGEAMPKPKDPSEDPAVDTTAGRIARRGQDPREQEEGEI